MFGKGFELATILRTGPDGLTRVIVRSSWAECESILVPTHEAELTVFRRWEEFHQEGARVHALVGVSRVLSYETRPSCTA